MLGHDYAPSAMPAGAPADAAPPGAHALPLRVDGGDPALREEGVSDESIDLMLKEAPRRFFTGA